MWRYGYRRSQGPASKFERNGNTTYQRFGTILFEQSLSAPLRNTCFKYDISICEEMYSIMNVASKPDMQKSKRRISRSAFQM
jgi:hypothetical protein